jgi:FkbM family methyltransferase
MPLFGLRDSAFRRFVLRVFRRLNPGDITITHHWTGNRLRLHSFNHKGYWWHGRNRERATIERFLKLVRPGETVIEVGAHIGYFSQLFSHLVGPTGKVVVFEPGENNLGYLRKNLQSLDQATVVEKAVSDHSGEVSFWLENLSGQNNSLIKDYHLLDGNIALSGLGTQVAKKQVTVQAVTLDEVVRQLVSDGHRPSFVKIDVEGAELMVLQGADHTLREVRPTLMVEVTREQSKIWELLKARDYVLRDAEGHAVNETFEGNVFCLPDEPALEKFGA